MNEYRITKLSPESKLRVLRLLEEEIYAAVRKIPTLPVSSPLVALILDIEPGTTTYIDAIEIVKEKISETEALIKGDA